MNIFFNVDLCKNTHTNPCLHLSRQAKGFSHPPALRGHDAFLDPKHKRLYEYKNWLPNVSWAGLREHRENRAPEEYGLRECQPRPPQFLLQQLCTCPRRTASPPAGGQRGRPGRLGRLRKGTERHLKPAVRCLKARNTGH